MTQDFQKIQSIELDGDQSVNTKINITDTKNNDTSLDRVFKYSKIIKNVLFCTFYSVGLIILVFSFFMYDTFYFNDSSSGGFLFQDASIYENVDYYTKQDLMHSCLLRMIKIVNIMETTLPHKLSKRLNSPQKNTILHGPPGTGKTLFVKKLAYSLDVNFKLAKIKKEIGDMEYKQLSISELKKKLEKCPSLVKICCVTPSILKSKWHGKSEKKIRTLFKIASKFSSDYKATIIFFDEMDSFFNTRSDNEFEVSLSSKSEFLNSIDGIGSNVSDKLFLLGATNRLKSLDSGFMRRFYYKIMFNLPTEEEFIEILNSHTQDWIDCSTRMQNFNYIAQKYHTIGFSHSEIVECLTTIMNEQDCQKPDVYLITDSYFRRLQAMKDGEVTEKIPQTSQNGDVLLFDGQEYLQVD